MGFLKNFIYIIFFSAISNAQSIVINEIVTSNSIVNTDEDESYQDWIELYNPSSQDVNLSGYGLTDDSSSPFKWIFPNITLNAGSYMIVWCSDKNKTNPEFELHTNFKISSDGETITLSNPSGFIVNQLPAIIIPSNYSYGINSTGSYSFYATPTPGAINSSDYTGILSEPIFSVNGGFFESGFTLTLSHPDPEVIIIYTLDGSEPEANNLDGTTYQYKNHYAQNPEDVVGDILNESFITYSYKEPIEITDRSEFPNKISSISTTFDTNPSYIPNYPVFKGTVVRAKAIQNGKEPSKIITKNYFITPKRENRYSLPIISLSLNENKLFDYKIGINNAGILFDEWRSSNPDLYSDSWSNANYWRSGDDWEVQANFSYFISGVEVVNQDIGLRNHGNSSRSFRNRSWRLYASSSYGENSINFPFFEDQNYTSYKRLILRNSGNDTYYTMFRDAVIQKMFNHLNFETQAYQPSVVFLNAEYWGIYNIRERFDKHYFERVYDIKDDELDYLENNALADEGDNQHYLNMIDFIENNSLSNDANFEHIVTMMDVDNYTDNFIANIYAANYDWPRNNIEFWRKKTDHYEPNAPYGQDGRWRWVMKDMDVAFNGSPDWINNSYTYNMLEHATSGNGDENFTPQWSTLLLRSLLENNSFKINFINRFADLLNTSFLPNRINSFIDDTKNNLASEIQEHIERWKTIENIVVWNENVNVMKTFADERPAYQRNHILQKFDINSTINATLDVSSVENGYIEMNTIEIKEGTPAIVSNPYPWTGIYFEGIPVKLKAVALPGFEFSHWSGASESTAEEITVTPSDDFSIQAHFVVEGTTPQTETIYFWLMDSNIANNQPLTTLNTTFKAGSVDGFIDYQSCLIGYPFTSANANWRRASMERRNSPTDINYIPEANGNLDFASSDMKGLQIKEPFEHSDGQDGTIGNTLIFNIPTTGFKDIKFSFAGINELTNATTFSLDYSFNSGTPIFAVSSMFPLTNAYQLYNYDLSSVVEANNNPDLKIRMRFFGTNMTADTGARITFNNIAVHGTKINLGVDENSSVQFSVYPNPFSNNINVTGINDTKLATYKLFTIDGKLIKKGNLSNAPIYLNDLSRGMYLLQLSSDGKIETKKIIKK